MQKQTAVVRCLLLALILAIGLALAWGVVWGSLWSAGARRRAVEARAGETYEQFLVRADGTPAIATISRVSYDDQTWRTLDGQPLERGGQTQPGNLPGPVQIEISALRTDWPSRILSWLNGQTSPERWYLIDDAQAQGHAWLEAFDTVTKQRIGYLGRRGFRTERLDAEERFPFDSRLKNAGGYVTGWAYWGIANRGWTPDPGDRIPGWTLFLVAEGGLWEIDLRRRSVRMLLRDAGLVSAAVVEQAVPANSYPQGPPAQHVAARSADRLWIVNPRTGATRQFPLRADLQGHLLQVYELSDGVLLNTIDRPTPFAAGPARLVWLDGKGKVIREEPYPLKSEAFSHDVDWPQFATTAPIPVVLGVGAFVAEPLDAIARGEATGYPDALKGSLNRLKWPIVFVTFLALAVAGWCYRRHRRYGQPGAAAWSLFVLLLGLPGLLAYLAHRRWPVCLPCAACGRSVPRDRDACLACHQPFPEPPPKGIEIFAAVRAEDT